MPSTLSSPWLENRAGAQGAAMKILVTGGTGTLGRGVVERLHERGPGPRVLSRRDGPGRVVGDLETGAGIAEAVRGVDAVVHAASRPGHDVARRAGWPGGPVDGRPRPDLGGRDRSPTGGAARATARPAGRGRARRRPARPCARRRLDHLRGVPALRAGAALSAARPGLS